MKITYGYNINSAKFTIPQAVNYVLTGSSYYGTMEKLETEVNNLKEMMGRLIEILIDDKDKLSYILGPSMNVTDN